MSRRLFTRMAVRDAWRNRWRSLLMVVMVALPVAAVTALDVVVKTADLQPGESMERTLGAADARVTHQGSAVLQNGANWESLIFHDQASAKPRPVDEVLGRSVSSLGLNTFIGSAKSTKGRVQITGMVSDWSSPVTAGLGRLTGGRVPRAADEVAVNAAMLDKGARLGESLEIDGHLVRVVGVMEDATYRADPRLFADRSTVLFEAGTGPLEWLLTDTGGITWADTQKLNRAGYSVASAVLVAHPPAASEVSPEFVGWDSTQDQMLAVLAVVVVMVLLEVVLLAGPGFAVSARRMQRSLALMAVSGATPRQARRAVMAMAWVMGLLAAVVGVVLGLVVASAGLHFGQPYVGQWLPPMQVPVPDLLVVAAFGLVAALLAAWAPARMAARQNPVATLAGRRADPPATVRAPLAGLVMLGVGVLLTRSGARWFGTGEMVIAVAAVICVLGMVLLLPTVLGWIGRLAGRLPLAGRYAVRDAARHRSRTVPAIAAVAATVAGAVALSIALASDAKEAEATYRPSYPLGMSVLVADTEQGGAKARTVVEEVAPGVRGEVVRGVTEDWDLILAEGEGEDREAGAVGPQLDHWGGLGVSALVGPSLPDFLGLAPAEQARATEALAEGKVLVFSHRAARLDRARVQITDFGAEQDGSDNPRTVVLPAEVVVVDRLAPVTQFAMAPATAKSLGLPVQTRGVVYPDSGITTDQENEIGERLSGLGEGWLSTERGYVRDPFVTVVIWSLVAAAAVLMLGGTLTSTLLSLSDAGADLRTLASVGAAPRTRRRIAAWYALVIATTGAVAGTLVGFIPGVAVTGPLAGGYLSIPWLVIGVVVVALPVASAGLMAVFTRSRVPLLERAD